MHNGWVEVVAVGKGEGRRRGGGGEEGGMRAEGREEFC